MHVQHVPGHGSIAFRIPDLYPRHRCEDDFALAYRRRLGWLRLARVVEDQLGLDPDEAVIVAAELLGAVADA